MKKKRMLALLLTVAMAGTMLAGCGRSDGKEDEKGKNQAKSEGKVYYLNFTRFLRIVGTEHQYTFSSQQEGIEIGNTYACFAEAADV